MGTKITCIVLTDEENSWVDPGGGCGCVARRGWDCLLTLLRRPARVTVVGSVCLSVRYSQSHFSGVCSSHKGHDLLNGQ